MLGNIARAVDKKENAFTTKDSSSTMSISREEAIQRLRAEYDRCYFLSGDMDLDLYDENCCFGGTLSNYLNIYFLRTLSIFHGIPIEQWYDSGFLPFLFVNKEFCNALSDIHI